MRIAVFRLREYLRSSLWFLPALFVLGSVALWAAVGALDEHLADDSPLAYGGGPDGAQELLSAIATSMIAFTGVVFSITIVVLQLASSQFSPRVLRTFLRDRGTQGSLGVFIATFVYALLVLRDVRTQTIDQSSYVPGVSVSMALVVLAVSLGMFVYYIHHVARAIRVAWILDAVADETRAVIDHEFPVDAGDDGRDRAVPDGPPTDLFPAPRPGILLAVDRHALVRLAHDAGCVLVLERAVGDFAVSNTSLLSVHGATLSAQQRDTVSEAIVIGIERTMEQDPAFGFRQIVDIAVRGLSPAVNDPTTAVQCLDHLHDFLQLLVSRPFRSGKLLDADGALRVVLPAPSWDDFLDLAFQEIRHYGAGSIQVMRRIRAALDDLAAAAPPDRLPAIEHHARALDEAVARDFSAADQRVLARRPDHQGLGSTVTG
ncbi:MAG TPA: DUF2254 domain-containing protein [Acidimicrobiia bacterium]